MSQANTPRENINLTIEDLNGMAQMHIAAAGRYSDFIFKAEKARAYASDRAAEAIKASDALKDVLTNRRA